MKITVFCGANNGRNEAYKENAKELGKWIAANNHTLVGNSPQNLDKFWRAIYYEINR